MHQLIFDGIHSSNWLLARAFNRVRVTLARRPDARVRWRLGGRELVLPLSHDLAWYRRCFPTYSDNLRRLARFLRGRDGALCMIDVGANIGDSWALTEPAPQDRYLLVEGEPEFFELLTLNTTATAGVTCVPVLLSDRPTVAPLGMVIVAGNARVDVAAATGNRVFETLDHVLDERPVFRAANLVKVDVEGFDGRVLRGGRALLAGAGPVVLFEHYPRLIRAAGDNDCALFTDLAGFGYGPMILYDNRGFLLGTLDPGDVGHVAELVSYARQQDGYYYDVIAFPSRRAADRDSFLREERAFYAAIEGAAGERTPCA
jgi:FkbM family methyltransferase